MENSQKDRGIAGSLFEDEVAGLFVRMGYHVDKNARLLGRTGMLHDVDIYFQAGGYKFLVECKTHFTRDNILSAYGKITDLNFDHAFLITRKLPEIMMEYAKQFNLTPIVLDPLKMNVI